MLVVALDTSTLLGTVGWISASTGPDGLEIDRFADVIAPVKPGHAETLLDRLKTVLSYGGFELKDVDLIVYGKGPGTFTGLRIGLATVKGIAIGAGCPVVGISSLEALALSSGVKGKVASLIDARRGELFAGFYEVDNYESVPTAELVGNEMVGSIDSVIEMLETKGGKEHFFVAGNGGDAYRPELKNAFGEMISVLPMKYWTPSSYWMCVCGCDRLERLGPDDINSAIPNYLREPDAKLPKE
jgi:tRNA threonylcarbamoyl adenosine modification protein YeaZ